MDDPDDRLRGNHWDPAPVIPTEMTIPANATTQTMTLTFPDDQRDLEPAGLVNVRVLPGTGYYLGQTGNNGTFTTLSVTDTDTAQELTFKWGRISSDSGHWEQGESYLACDQNGDNCTPGPAEGTFHYEDDRSFAVTTSCGSPIPPISWSATAPRTPARPQPSSFGWNTTATGRVPATPAGPRTRKQETATRSSP